MILPPSPWSTMTRAAACATRNAPLRLTAWVRSQVSSVSSKKSVNGQIPALRTATSTRPNVRTVSSTSRWTSAPTETSAWTTSGSPPASRTCAAVSSAAARSRSKSTLTAYPSDARDTQIPRPNSLATPR